MVSSVAQILHLVFPMHPRTRKQLEVFGLLAKLQGLRAVTITEPLGYLEFLRLMESAEVVITDSGGIQEETTFLGVPCLTLRENTERPVTITSGTNELLPVDAERVTERVRALLKGGASNREMPPLWDGNAAPRIVDCLASVLGAGTPDR